MSENDPTVGGLLQAALPSALAVGIVGIGALLVNIQIQQAATAAAVQQLVKSVDEIKTDSKQQLEDLERRVRAIEMRK